MVSAEVLDREIREFISNEWVVPESMRDELAYIILHIADELWTYKLAHHEVCNKLDIMREACIRGLYSYIFHKNGYELISHRISVHGLFPLGFDIIAYPDWLKLFFQSVGRVEEEILYIERMLALGLYEINDVAKKVEGISNFSEHATSSELTAEMKEQIKCWLIDKWGLPVEWQAQIFDELWPQLEIILKEGQYQTASNDIVYLDKPVLHSIIGELTMRSLYTNILKNKGYELTSNKIHITSNIPIGYEFWNNNSWYDEFIYAAGRVETYMKYVEDLINEDILQSYGEIIPINLDVSKWKTASKLTDREKEYIDLWLKQQDYYFYILGSEIPDEIQVRRTNTIFYEQIIETSKRLKLSKTHFRVLAESLGRTLIFLWIEQLNEYIKAEPIYIDDVTTFSEVPYGVDGFDIYLITRGEHYCIIQDFRDFLEGNIINDDVDTDVWSRAFGCSVIYQFIDTLIDQYFNREEKWDNSQKFHLVKDETLNLYSDTLFDFKSTPHRSNWKDYATMPFLEQVPLNNLKILEFLEESKIQIVSEFEPETIFEEKNQAFLKEWLVHKWGLPIELEERFFEVFNYILQTVENKLLNKEYSAERTLKHMNCATFIAEVAVHALYYIILDQENLLLVKKGKNWIEDFFISTHNVKSLINHVRVLAKWQVWQLNSIGIRKVIISDEDPQDGKRMLVSHMDISSVIMTDTFYESIKDILNERPVYQGLGPMVIYRPEVFDALVYTLFDEEQEDELSSLDEAVLMDFLHFYWGLPVKWEEYIREDFLQFIKEERERKNLSYNHLMVLGIAAIKALYWAILKKRGFIPTGIKEWQSFDWVTKYIRATGLIENEINQVNTLLDWGIYQGAGLVAQDGYKDILR